MNNDREIKCLRRTLQSIIDLGYDYDGYGNSLDGCKRLIDEFVNMAYDVLYKHQSDTYLDGNGNHIINIFDEVVGEYNPNTWETKYYDKDRKDY